MAGTLCAPVLALIPGAMPAAAVVGYVSMAAFTLFVVFTVFHEDADREIRQSSTGERWTCGHCGTVHDDPWVYTG